MKRSHSTAMLRPKNQPNATRRLFRQPTVDPEFVQNAHSSFANARVVEASSFHDGSLLDTLAAEHMTTFHRLASSIPASGTLKGKVTWASMCSGMEGDHWVMMAVQQAINQAATASGQNQGAIAVTASGQDQAATASGHDQDATASGHDHEATASGQVPGAGEGADAPQLVFEHLFSCEIDPGKRTWIDALVNTECRANTQRLVCIFGDITQMGNTTQYCYAHKKKCPIPDVQILLVSTSCKDLSRLAHNAPNAPPVLSLQTSPGGSADTWRGLLSYMDAHPPSILFYENSDNLEDSSSSGTTGNMDVFQAELSARGMEGQCFVLNAKMFGCPHNRRRFYAAFIRLPSATTPCALTVEINEDRSLADTFQTVCAFVVACQRRPPSARDVLLPDGHNEIENELARRTNVSSPELDGPRAWVVEHQRMYDLLRLSWGVEPRSPATKASPWFSTLTRYQQSVLTLHQYRLFLSQPSTAFGQSPNLMIDLHPSASRAPSTSTKDGDVEIAPCILPSQLIWLHLPRERLMTGTEAIIFQGFPVTRLPSPCTGTNRQRQDLAGNAVPLPVQLAVVLSTVHAVTWALPRGEVVPPGPRSSQGDVDNAMSLFSSLFGQVAAVPCIAQASLSQPSAR
jgi:site-specific DNA-cytosine methylase